MNWIKNFVRPKLKDIVSGGNSVPENLWHKCPSCEQLIFHRDLDKNHHVCSNCGHHMRISAKQRLELLMGEDFQLIELPDVASDPLKFKDKKKYADRLKAIKGKLEDKQKDAILVAKGKILEHEAVIAAFDFSIMGGSMGVAVGEAIVTAAEYACQNNLPLITIPSSGGARMQEGILSLMQMARTTVAVQMLKEANLPHIVVLTDPTTGGVSASFAMLGDVHIAEEGCVIGFAGARVIEQTIRQKLPEGFQRAKYLYEHGMVDMVVNRFALRQELAKLIAMLMASRNQQLLKEIPSDPMAAINITAKALPAPTKG